MMRKILACVLACLVSISSFSALAETSFADVKQGDWYYETVTEMTKRGLFEGKGNNLFCPQDKMTKAEYLTVLVRTVYPDEDISPRSGEKWWQAAYDKAEGSILYYDDLEKDFATTEMDKHISRQEMAVVSVRAVQLLLQHEIAISDEVVTSAHIADIKCADAHYVYYMKKAYAAGIIAGDENGNFNPKATLTRAEASTVLYRIAEPSARMDTSFLIPKIGQQIIHEGEKSKRVPAQEGDIFIKADGTQIVLKKGPNGVVGEGQGVAPDIGMYGTNSGYVIPIDKWENKIMIGLIDESLYPYFRDAYGRSLNNDNYSVNATTGEGHWTGDWQKICEGVPKPDYDGTFHGEISKDAYSLYAWSDIVDMWVYNFVY